MNLFPAPLDNAVVYGDGIDVFTATETLLRLGVRGSRIHLVLPPPGGGDPRLGDPVVEGAVATALKEAEVQVHRHCLLTRMDVGGDDGPLTSVSFASEEEPLRLQCGVSPTPSVISFIKCGKQLNC